MIRWRKMVTPGYNDVETWFARYRGWTLYASLLKVTNVWRTHLHRFTPDGMANAPVCQEVYDSREGAQNAAEFYAEHGRFPHAVATRQETDR